MPMPRTNDTRPADGNKRRPRATLLALALFASALGTVHAQEADSDTIAVLRTELEALKAEQVERDARIKRLEDSLHRLAGEAAVPASTPAVATAAPAQAPASVAAAPANASPRLKVSGDFRLRAQGDWSDDSARNRSSMQVRGRLGATWAASDRLTVGARLATGDADDPNSSDVQLSNWLDDLEVSLDMAYVRFDAGRLSLYGGKMPQPFVRTDLVWDGDVNPQGLGATWQAPLATGGTVRANALAFLVDEDAAGPDSRMFGGQFGYASPVDRTWAFDVHAAYYRYGLGSLAGADSGDFRSNLRAPDGSYLSDFHLANAMAGVTWTGLDPRWPLRLAVDYVKNLGARVDADTGYGVDLTLGRAAAPGDWRFTWGYSMAEADAVLAAFSQDNIGLGTNYRLHALSVDYVPTPRTMLSAYWYHYTPYSALYAGTRDPDDWLDRLRLAFLVNF